MFAPWPSPEEISSIVNLMSPNESGSNSNRENAPPCESSRRRVPTIWGEFGLSATPNGLTDCCFPNQLSRHLDSSQNNHHPSPLADPIVVCAGLELQQYVAGTKLSLQSPIDLNILNDFRRDIYRALLQIPYGNTVTYSQLAFWAGHPGAARAVGRAMATNPVPLFIPCHRVLRADGTLGGWSGPDGFKEKLLIHEHILLPR